MSPLLDAFWRAAAYCLHPRVILLSLAPLLLAGGLALASGYFFWEPAVAGVRATLESWSLLAALLKWFDGVGGEGLRALVAPLRIHTLVIAFAALWFAHFTLTALQRQREQAAVPPPQPVPFTPLLPASPPALP